MQSSVKTVRVLTLLLLGGSVLWLLLCIGSAAMQTSSEHASELFRWAWPPLALSTVVGAFLATAARRVEGWRSLLSLGWWTLGVSLACLALVVLGIRNP